MPGTVRRDGSSVRRDGEGVSEVVPPVEEVVPVVAVPHVPWGAAAEPVSGGEVA